MLIGAGVVVLIVIVLLVKGCGSGLSEQELRTQASEICNRVAATTDRVAVPNAPAGGERFLSEGLTQLRPALVRLQRLQDRAPDSLRRDYELAVSANARQLQLIGNAVRDLRGGADPIDTYQQLQRRLALVSPTADATWRRLRIPACVSH
ncbi:hypothetical protein Q7L65_15940 [Conexibacter sp. CPCC 206217]|nr:hypothetical protein [Conexibacter sp. CPCC 206217]